ncbi:MAG: iron-containing alcohol dehydrogenase [Oscillospiraceae bacterium]|nr:iron-containing alcohol dehydrogenase [Oscillospiraceae bacterium]
MHPFQFYLKTEVVFGADTHAQVASLVKKHGGSRVLVVYGGGSCVRSGLLQTVTDGLTAEGLTFDTFGGAQPNPRLAHAREGVKKALAFGADFILAVGGGSSIDTAKAIAVGAAAPDTDIWDFWTRKAEPKKVLPVGVVLTLPAAGSETSDSAVLTDEATMTKRGLSTDLNRPAFAVLDPKLAATLPKYQVACGVTDILMHTLDRYFNPVPDNEISDAMAEALLRVVLENGRKVYADPADLHAMSEIMWCGSLSHNGLTGLGGKKDFAVHQLGHALSARYDVAHGASLAAVWGSWAKAVADADGYARFAGFGRKVWGIAEADDKKAALLAIEKQVAYFKSLDMPVCLADFGLGDMDTEELAELCSYGKTRNIGTFRVLDHDAVCAIYRAAKN